jgi:hypothetical protein
LPQQSDIESKPQAKVVDIFSDSLTPLPIGAQQNQPTWNPTFEVPATKHAFKEFTNFDKTIAPEQPVLFASNSQKVVPGPVRLARQEVLPLAPPELLKAPPQAVPAALPKRRLAQIPELTEADKAFWNKVEDEIFATETYKFTPSDEINFPCFQNYKNEYNNILNACRNRNFENQSETNRAKCKKVFELEPSQIKCGSVNNPFEGIGRY